MTTDAVRDRSRDYVAFMECGAGDAWLPQVDSQVASWLREKGFDVDLSVAGDHALGSSRLMVRRATEGHSADLYLRLTEDGGSGGIWTTDLVAHDEPGAKDWISLTVSNSLGKFVAVPRVARYLMQVLPLRDSALDFTDKPQLFGESDIDALVALLADDTRHGLVFVAGSNATSGIPLQPYVDKVGEWARQVFGLAQVIVLDPLATAAFAARVGDDFEAPAWSIRTYQPDVRFGDWLDRRRHRILGTSRLGTQSDTAIQHLLGDVARQQAATRPLDPSLVRVSRRFARLENRRLVDQLETSPRLELMAGGPETISGDQVHVDVVVGVEHEVADRSPIEPVVDDRERLLREALGQVSLVKRVLGLKQITEVALKEFVAQFSRQDAERAAIAALQARVEALQSEKEAAEDVNRVLLDALDGAQLEAEVARMDVDNRDAKVRWLEARLKEHNDFEAAYQQVPVEFLETRPRNFADLLERLSQFQGVLFTGDVSEVERLNQIDTNDAALRVAWDAALTLEDYVRARRAGDCSQGLDYYINHTPSGYRTFPPGKFGETETGITMRQHGDERIFPVPTTVDASGTVTMKAHFKLARIGMATPRMYVLDGHPGEPIVYIGYLGTHLTNTQTN